MKHAIISIILLGLVTIAHGEDGKFGATVFYEFTCRFDKKVSTNYPFEMQRVYFTFEKEISPTLAYKFQTDAGRGRDGWLTAYLRSAMMDWTSSWGKFTFGMQGMNMFNIQEQTWGHRYLEKTSIDLHDWASPADLGVGFTKSSAMLHFDAKITNGEGYKRAERNWYKKVSIQLVLGEKDLLENRGYNIGGVASYEPFESYSGKSATVVAGVFAGWSGAAIRTGLEVNVKVRDREKETLMLLSGYATYQFGSKLSVLVRCDQLDSGSSSETYVILGLAFVPEKGLTITPNIRYEKSGDGSDLTLLKVNFHFDV